MFFFRFCLSVSFHFCCGTCCLMESISHPAEENCTVVAESAKSVWFFNFTVFARFSFFSDFTKFCYWKRKPSIASIRLYAACLCFANGWLLLTLFPSLACHLSPISQDIHIFTVLKSEIRILQALIWDITVKPKPIEDPILAFAAGGEVTDCLT